jgi:hypothetical protein
MRIHSDNTLAMIIGVSLLVLMSPGMACAEDIPPRHEDSMILNHDDDDEKNPAVHLSIENVAISQWEDGERFGIEIQLHNDGPQDATAVRVMRIKVDQGQFSAPPRLPFFLGDLGAGQDSQFGAVIRGNADGTPRRLIVRGVYEQGMRTFKFTAEREIVPNPVILAPVAGHPGQAVKQNPSAATYPPIPPPLNENNAETPMLIPPGPPRQLFAPTPLGTDVGGGSGGTTPAGSSVIIPRNTTSINGAGTPPDPNAATQSVGGVVLSTYNTGISYSVDGGQNFTDVSLFAADPTNPARTTFFPESDGGLCCDQVVRYLPSQNLFVWLLQYWPVTAPVTTPGTPPGTRTVTAPNRLRIAWATPAAIASDFRNAWTYADLTGAAVPNVSSGLGTATTEWMDYPDLAQSKDFLYVGVDHGTSSPGSVFTGRRIVARLSLSDISNPAASVVNYQFAELTGSNGLNKSHFVQDAPSRLVLGSLDNSSTLRVFDWLDTDSVINPNTVPISSIQTGTSYTELAPDGSNWVGVSFPGNISGATFRSPSLLQEYIFAFDAGITTNRPHPYVRLESVINIPVPIFGNFSATAEYDIWNPNYAFAMAALGTQGGEIGMALAVGGGTIGYPQDSVGFKDDFEVYSVTSSNATQVTRFGDYFSARPIPGAVRFSTEAYDVLLAMPPAGTVNPTCATVGCSARMRYVEFGRPEPPMIQ